MTPLTPPKYPAPHEYKTMDDLYSQALHYSAFTLSKGRIIQPAIFILSADGPPALMIWTHDFNDEKAKDNFVIACRIFGIAHAATHTLITVEAWALAEVGPKPTCMPSESPNRIEVVNFITETKTISGPSGVHTRPIIRDGNGQFFGFGDDLAGPTAAKIRTRFYPILGPELHYPTELRMAAKASLATLGYAPAR